MSIHLYIYICTYTYMYNYIYIYIYITLPSWCINIYKGRFLPAKPTVANDANKPISKVSLEWFSSWDNSNTHREEPWFVEQRNLYTFDKHENKLLRHEQDEPVEFDDYVNDSCIVCLDGLDGLNETVYEFYGCKVHGCQKWYNQGQQLYNTTTEREQILTAAG